jgi:hypothetical protein
MLAEILRLRDEEWLRWSQVAARVHPPSRGARSSNMPPDSKASSEEMESIGWEHPQRSKCETCRGETDRLDANLLA